jgi:uncharacterized protein
MVGRILFTLGLLVMVDLYFFQAFKAAFSESAPSTRKLMYWGYWIVESALIGLFVYLMATGRIRPGGSSGISFYTALLFLSLVPKLVVMPFMLLEDVVRLVEAGYSWVQSLISTEKSAYYPGRRKFLGQMMVGFAALQFSAVLYGVTKGKYRYRVIRQDVWSSDLPEAFDGFTITQLSDVHSGSFDDMEEVRAGVAMANDQKSDLLVFTGDLVNSRAEEMDPYKEIFGGLQAAFGKYSILGNHDYGDYARWPTPEEKTQNFDALLQTQKDMGFQLLRNESVRLEKDGQSIDLLGVENWGRSFRQYGDLDKALVGVSSDSFKVLLSHDPSHWEAKAVPHQEKIHLTLSGHTHGMQFGVEIPGFKWSPVQYVYKQWSGLYQQAEQQLYVNRGFGFLGFPGRVGMWPEITVLTLRRITNY